MRFENNENEVCFSILHYLDLFIDQTYCVINRTNLISKFWEFLLFFSLIFYLIIHISISLKKTFIKHIDITHSFGIQFGRIANLRQTQIFRYFYFLCVSLLITSFFFLYLINISICLTKRRIRGRKCRYIYIYLYIRYNKKSKKKEKENVKESSGSQDTRSVQILKQFLFLIS